jgi:signal transduction histidine kinase
MGGTSGLSGMQERAVLLGGRLAVKSKPGEGSRVVAEWPLKRE